MCNNGNGVKANRIIKGIGAGLCLLDKNFRILWVNKIQADWFGKSRNLLGRHCYRMFEHRSHRCYGCPSLRAFKTGEVCKAIRRGFTKDGKPHFYQLTVSPVRDKNNKVVQVLELAEDITDRLAKQKSTSDIINKLKKSQGHLLIANRTLHRDTERLRQMNKTITQRKGRFYRKYRHKIEELSIAKEELRGIIKINNACGSNLGLKKICNLVAKLTCKVMHTQACTIRLFDEKRGILLIEGEWGLRKNHLSATPLRLGESLSGSAAKSGKPAVVYKLAKVTNPKKLAEFKKREGLASAVAMPMIINDKILGVISTYSRTPRHFTEEEIKPLIAFASQSAVAIQEAKLGDDIHRTYFNTIHSLVLAMEARDPYTRGHADRVTRYSIEIAQELGLPEADIEILRYAGEVHDVGKIAIPDGILNKPGKLTPIERAAVEVHPVRGAEMLGPLQFLRSGIPLVRHHHERYDGKGYPDGLEKDKIPVMARILACADAFDAMTSDRPYRKCKLSIKKALFEIKINTGTQFDPKIAKIFTKIIKTE